MILYRFTTRPVSAGSPVFGYPHARIVVPLATQGILMPAPVVGSPHAVSIILGTASNIAAPSPVLGVPSASVNRNRPITTSSSGIVSATEVTH